METAAASKITKAQARELVTALKEHPRPTKPKTTALARRLAGLGFLRGDDDTGYVLTKAGLDAAAKAGAQRIIDTVNSLPKQPTPPPASAAASPRKGAAGTAPPDWPFPVSGHEW